MADEPFRKLRIQTQAHSTARPTQVPTLNGSRESSELGLQAARQSSGFVLDSSLEGAITDYPSHESSICTPSIYSTSNVSQLRHALRDRGISISFNPEVRLDDGDSRALDEPLPKATASRNTTETPPQSIPIRQRPRRHSDTEREEYDVVTGAPLEQRPRGRYLPGEMRHPLLQSTVDDLARDSHIPISGMVPSLTSEMTASPLSEDVGTPLDRRLLSPVDSSPLDFSGRSREAGVGRRSVSQRSFGSLGSVGRRRTIKSATSSLSSPARSFLSQWTHSEPKEPDPDEDGQEIAGSGYIIGRQIGYGGFSIVREVTTMEGDTKVVRAVKIVRKQIQDRSDVDNEQLQNDFEREVSVWRYLQHRYILPLISVYDTPFATFCITKLNTGGTLFDLIRARRKDKTLPNGLPANLAKRYIYQLGSAIRYLHEDIRVVHRDIKPENCLQDMSSSDSSANGGNVLLCDFGMADFIHNERSHMLEDEHGANIGPSQTSTSIQGSLAYTAPELINTNHTVYSTAADMWAFGCTMYTLLTGDLPFQHEFQPRLIMMISKGDYDTEALMSCPAVQESGHSVIELVKGCLTLHPDERWTISQALECEWLQGCRALYEESDFP
jgi:Protein kinase domain